MSYQKVDFMRIKTRENPKSPANRIIKKFAFTPIKIEEEIRFMETVYIFQSVMRDSIGDMYHWRNSFFMEQEQIDDMIQEKDKLVEHLI